MARDILSCLTKRRTTRASWSDNNNNNNDAHDAHDDILQVWNTVEMQLKEAERNLKQYEGGVMRWDARTLPRTPKDLPLYLSQLSSAPDKGAAFGTWQAVCVCVHCVCEFVANYTASIFLTLFFRL
jgi:hypothetical protein